MKFQVYPHQISYYMTNVNNFDINFIPVEDFTLIKVNGDTYSLPYGLLDYRYLISANDNSELDDMLTKVITGIGVSKYAIDVNKVLNYVPNNTAESDINLLLGTLQGLLKNNTDEAMSKAEYNSTIDQVIETGNLMLGPDQINFVKHLGEILDPVLTDAVFPAFKELITQLNNSGILEELKDPKAMMKSYQEGK